MTNFTQEFVIALASKLKTIVLRYVYRNLVTVLRTVLRKANHVTNYSGPLPARKTRARGGVC